MDTVNTSNDIGQAGKIIFRCSITAVLQDLRSQSVRGVHFVDADKAPRVAHLALAAYSGDVPELHLVSCTKQTVCVRFTVDKADLAKPGVLGSMRTNDEKKGLLEEVFLEGPVTEPALLDWPFSFIPGLAIYTILRFDLMHLGPLGFLKHILEAAWKLLRSDSLVSPYLRDSKGKPKTFASNRTRVLREANEYLTLTDLKSPAIGFRVDFARGKKRGDLDGLFTESGVATMLQAKDMRMVSEMLPFIGVLIDRYYGNGDAAATVERCEAEPTMTKVFVLYQKMDRELRRKDLEEPGFTDADIQGVREAILECETNVVKVLGQFQASGFCCVKTPEFGHCARDICDLAVVGGFDTVMYEAPHPMYKAASKETSRRHGTSVADATTILSRNEGTRAQLREGAAETVAGALAMQLVTGRKSVSTPTPPVQRAAAGLAAIKDDAALLPRDESKTTWLGLR